MIQKHFKAKLNSYDNKNIIRRAEELVKSKKQNIKSIFEFTNPKNELILFVKLENNDINYEIAYYVDFKWYSVIEV